MIGGSIILTEIYSDFKDILNLKTLNNEFNRSKKYSNDLSDIESYFKDFYQEFKAIISKYINLFITVILILSFEFLIGRYTLSNGALNLANLAYSIYMIALSILLIISYLFYDKLYSQSEDILKYIKHDIGQFKKEYNTLNFFWNIFINKLPVCIFIFIIIAILRIVLQSSIFN